jgi:ABC-type proline/glycine betaine transport system ATPase subunit
MKQQTKLSEEQQQQSRQVGTGQQTQQPSAREFANAEEMLRYDAAHTIVPPVIAQRLQKSTAELPRSKAAWWKRLLGGTHP